MSDDKQRQVQAARDALMGDSTERVGRTIDLSASTHGGKTLTVRVNSVRWARMQELEAAADAWYIASGIDRGDRLRNAARKLWEMREAR